MLFNLPGDCGKVTTESVISTTPSVAKKVELKQKRKQKRNRRESKAKKAKEDEVVKADGKSSLSDQDKQMLERWTKMQKSTTPFVHPIRKHMQELIKIKKDTIVDNSDVTTASNESEVFLLYLDRFKTTPLKIFAVYQRISPQCMAQPPVY